MSDKQESDTGAAVDPFGRALILKSDLRQRDVAAWNRAYLTYAPGRSALAVERQAALQAAIEAGWIESPECRYEDVIDPATGARSRRHYFDGVQVDDLLPAEVNHYGNLCTRRFDEVMRVPKPSSSR